MAEVELKAGGSAGFERQAEVAVAGARSGAEPLSSAFEALDGIGASFGLYLASRLDRVSAAEAAALAELGSRARPVPGERVEKLLATRLGAARCRRFGFVEALPCASDFLFQWHRARLADGGRVMVKLVRDEIAAGLEQELERFASWSQNPESDRLSELFGLAGDFRRGLERTVDLEREADDLVRLRASSRDLRLVTVPRVHRELGAPGVLVVDDPRNGPDPGAVEAEGERAARRMCRLWLRLALSSARVPVEPAGINVVHLAAGGVAFTGGPFAPAVGRLQHELRSYLAAAVVGDARRATAALVELSAHRGAADERRLRHRIRHAEPFRDGGWPPDADSLARVVFAHWRLAARIGFEPRPFFLAFLRGLFWVTREAGRMAPREASFHEAFQELRLGDVLSEAARFADPGELQDLVRRQATLVTDLPRKLDFLLSTAAEERRRDKRVREDERETPAAYSWIVLGALVLALTAITVVVSLLDGADGLAWLERVGALAFALLGALALRSAGAE